MAIWTRRALWLAGVCGAAALGNGAAGAQTSPAAPPAGPQAGTSAKGLEEIVVTAERRSARLQTVPISVTALTAKTLAQKQVTDVITLAKVTPGLQSKPTLTPLEISLSIRGVTQLIPSLNVDPAIGTYIDGVYDVINAGSNAALIDEQRVEVLNGPQGTLFGRNTIGGAISITTNPPTDHFNGYVEGGYGNYNAKTFTGMVNGPLMPGVVDARLVFQHTDHDGYGTDYTTHTPTSTLDQNYIRGSVKIRPSADVDIDLSSFYTHAHGYGFPENLGYLDPTESLAPGYLPPVNSFIPAVSGHPGDLLTNYILPGGSQNSYSNNADTFLLEQYGVTATEVVRLGMGVTVKAITGFIDTYYNTQEDLDGTPYGVLALTGYPISARQVSQELQAYGDLLDGRLKYIGGLYYFNVTGSQQSQAQALEALSPGGQFQGPTVDNSSYSGFAQATYAVTPTVDLTGGVRFVRDTRSVVYHDFTVASAQGGYEACLLANDPGGLNPAQCRYASFATFHYLPFTVGVDWKPNPSTLIYAKFSQGYRSGAYPLAGPAEGATPADNARALQLFQPVAPEKLISPEVGAKQQFFDDHLRVNAAAFYSRYSNLQETVNKPGATPTSTPDAVLENSGTAHIFGGEAAVTALLGQFTLDVNGGYANPQYISGALRGTPVINVSKFNGSVTGSYPIDFSLGTLNLSSTYSYRTRATFYTLSPGLPSSVLNVLSQNAFGLWDARVSFDMAHLPVTISAYAQNLLGTSYILASQSFSPPLGYAARSPGTPRTYGFTVRYSF
jgi:iron complex outermembrane receptor protein